MRMFFLECFIIFYVSLLIEGVFLYFYNKYKDKKARERLAYNIKFYEFIKKRLNK